MKRAPDKKKSRRRGRRTTAVSYPEVAELRRRVGKLYGKPIASRGVMARLLGAAHGSILNWEKGKSPSPVYVRKLREMEEQLNAGALHVEPPRRGGRRPKSLAVAAARVAVGRSGAVITGEPPVIYANLVSIDQGETDARMRFGLLLPGALSARAVSDVIVPRSLFDQMRSALARLSS